MWKNSPLRLLGALLAVSLLAAACGSNTATDTTADTGQPGDSMSDDAMSDDAMSDDHGDDHGPAIIEVDAEAPTPELTIELTETDTAGTFDLVVSLTNFTITPENVDGDPIANEGHMHLLLDGEKVERFTDVVRTVDVPGGEHLVEVELNANDHSAYAIDGVPIRAGVSVVGHGDAAATDDNAMDDADSHEDDDHSAGAAAIEEGLDIDDADVSIDARLQNGQVSVGTNDRIQASAGDVVSIMLKSDVSEQAHLHGYDIVVDVEAGDDASMILFTADTAGKFELEFEKSGTFIAELIVS